MQKRLRIFGTIVKDTTKEITGGNLRGYVILDTKTKQLKYLSVEQTQMMLKRYTFSNAEIKGREIKNTECSMSRLVMYSMQTMRPSKQGVTVLAKVKGKSRYRVMTQDGKETTLDEGKLVELVSRGVSLINGKVVTRGGKGYISAIRGEYEEITEERESKGVDTQSNHARYLEKVDRRFKISLVKYWSLNNWGVPDRDVMSLEDTQKHNKFKKAVDRYYKEYVKEHHPEIVEVGERVLGGVEGTKSKFEIIKVSVYKEVLEEGKDLHHLRPLRFVDSEYVRYQLYGNKEFMSIVWGVSRTMGNFFYIMGIEARMSYKSLESKRAKLESLYGEGVTPFSSDKQGNQRLRTQLVEEILLSEEYERLAEQKEQSGLNTEPYKRAMSGFPILGETFSYQRYARDGVLLEELKPVKVNGLEYPASLHVFGWGIEGGEERQVLGRADRVNKNYDKVRDIYEGYSIPEVTKEAIRGVSTSLGDFTTARDLISMSGESKSVKEDIFSRRKGKYQSKYIEDKWRRDGLEVDVDDIEEILYILLLLNNKALYRVVVEEGALPEDSQYRSEEWVDLIEWEKSSLREADRYYYASGFKCNAEYLPRNAYYPKYSAAPEGSEVAIILGGSGSAWQNIQEILGKLYIGSQ